METWASPGSLATTKVSGLGGARAEDRVRLIRRMVDHFIVPPTDDYDPAPHLHSVWRKRVSNFKV